MTKPGPGVNERAPKPERVPDGTVVAVRQGREPAPQPSGKLCDMAPRTLVPRAVTARATSHRPWRGLGLLVVTAVLSACGGGGGGGGGGTIVSPPAPTACTVARRNQFVHDTTRDWYLFLDLLPASVDTSAYASPQELLDAMTATARAQGKDRGFSYVTSIAEENAYIQQGSQAGFGIRLRYDSVNLRLYIIESFEGSPAGDAGLAEGCEPWG